MTKPAPIDDLFESRLTDAANAEALAQTFHRSLAWVPEVGRWRSFRSEYHVWRDDEDGEAERCAITITNALWDQVRDEGDRTKAIKLLAHARRSANQNGIAAMLELAKACGLTVPERRWNAAPFLLGVENGIVDLRTGELRPGASVDYISKRAGAPFKPNALCPQWIAFLDRIMDGNVAMIEFLQRAIGYSLTGDAGEQCMFIAHGIGGNGKSVLLRTVSAVLGGYARACPADSLLARREHAIPNDIARLSGARFVTAIETEDGGRLAESMVKALTGGDTITARFLHREFFEFQPQLKLWLATNHKPTIRGNDLAIWRRIKLVPFDVTIPDAEQDHELGDKLRAEAAGILAWAVRGCLAWQQAGLQFPAPVVDATATYRNEQDHIGQWIEERCVIATGARVQAKFAYADYRKWCDGRGERAMTMMAFGLRLTERGIQKQRGRTVVYIGIGLCETSDTLQPESAFSLRGGDLIAEKPKPPAGCRGVDSRTDAE